MKAIRKVSKTTNRNVFNSILFNMKRTKHAKSLTSIIYSIPPYSRRLGALDIRGYAESANLENPKPAAQFCYGSILIKNPSDRAL